LIGGVVDPVLTEVLRRLSGPRQLTARTGVTVYSHDPVGTPLSVQVTSATVPAQPASVVPAVGRPVG
jgi:hypothetical protein